MAVSDTTIVETADLLLQALDDVEGLRVYAYVADTFRPPGVVIGLPTIDYTDPLSGFCGATYEHALSVIVSRNSDREAQRELARWVAAIASALRDATIPGGKSIDLQEARPGSHTVNGQELPGYTLRVLVRA
jgi:hypothetical protein